MEFLKNLVRKINSNPIIKHLVLALCALIVFIFIANTLLNVFTRHGQVRHVPDFSGMTIEEAKKAAKSGSLRLEVNDSVYIPAYPGGIILEQNPNPNAQVKSGRRVFLTVNASQQKRVMIPYVTGYSLRQAKNNLEMAGLGIDQLIYQSDLATNYVLEQRFNGKIISASSNIEAEIGSGVTLVVGKGENAAAQSVPRIVGFSLREAKSRLWEAGFNVGKITYDEGVNLLNEKDAKVVVQSPGVGTRREYGAEVSLTLSLDEKKIEEGLKGAEKAAQNAARENLRAAQEEQQAETQTAE